jgi:hypothetical protein
MTMETPLPNPEPDLLIKMNREVEKQRRVEQESHLDYLLFNLSELSKPQAQVISINRKQSA